MGLIGRIIMFLLCGLFIFRRFLLLLFLLLRTLLGSIFPKLWWLEVDLKFSFFWFIFFGNVSGGYRMLLNITFLFITLISFLINFVQLLFTVDILLIFINVIKLKQPLLFPILLIQFLLWNCLLSIEIDRLAEHNLIVNYELLVV